MRIILGHGVYNIPEASKLTRLRPQRVREWFTGRTAARKPIFKSDYHAVRGDQVISFLDLVELFVAGQLRDHGVSLQALRKVHRKLQSDLGTQHPFSREEILSDGKKVFVLGLDEKGTEEMVEVLSRQKVFVEILLPFLKRIDYDSATRLARKWCIADRVVLDPAICLGKPIVEKVGVATGILAAAFHANGRDAGIVADWYGVQQTDVLAAVSFEQSLVA
jgi:uncharacterized protein (DUF433 family)